MKASTENMFSDTHTKKKKKFFFTYTTLIQINSETYLFGILTTM